MANGLSEKMIKEMVDKMRSISPHPQDHGLPPYPTGEVVGACVCGSWPGGKCLRCPVIPATQEPDHG